MSEEEEPVGAWQQQTALSFPDGGGGDVEHL